MAGIISGWIRTGVARHVRVDPGTHAVLATGVRHAALHNGDSYIASYSVADIGALTTPDDLMTLSFTTPNSAKYFHVEITAGGTSGALLSLIEGKTGGGATPTGTIQTYNRNRGSVDTSPITDVAGATITDDSVGVDAFGHKKLAGAAKYVRRQIEKILPCLIILYV